MLSSVGEGVEVEAVLPEGQPGGQQAVLPSGKLAPAVAPLPPC